MKIGKPWWNLGETFVEPWLNLINLGGTFRGTFWQPKNDLPQTKESPKTILPRNLYYALDPKATAVGEKLELEFGESLNINMEGSERK